MTNFYWILQPPGRAAWRKTPCAGGTCPGSGCPGRQRQSVALAAADSIGRIGRALDQMPRAVGNMPEKHYFEADWMQNQGTFESNVLNWKIVDIHFESFWKFWNIPFKIFKDDLVWLDSVGLKLSSTVATRNWRCQATHKLRYLSEILAVIDLLVDGDGPNVHVFFSVCLM